MENKLYQDVLQKFDAGMASMACVLVLEEAKATAQSGEESDLNRSDELARLAVRLHWWGDDLDRQKYQKKLLEYQAIEKEIADAQKELVGILQHYIDIFQRFVSIADTSQDITRIFWSPFERVVHGRETGFSNGEEVRQYHLGPIKDDLAEFISYTTSFSNSFVARLTRRSIHPGKYHVYAQILLDLELADGKFQRIEKVQHQLRNLLTKRQYSPNRPWVTEEEASIRDRIDEVLKGHR